MRKITFTLICCVLGLLAVELALRQILFSYVSYSNSESIDKQLQDRNESSDWNILFIGDSETRWGINPNEIDSAFAAHGVNARSFNHAFDGFGASWWPRLLPNLLQESALKNVEVVVVGIQMTSTHRVVGVSGEDCSALQKPVLTSPFAKDISVSSLCRKLSWDAELGKKLFGSLWIVRYSSSVRALLMPQFMHTQGQLSFNSRKEGEQIKGFEPHRSIAADDQYDQEFDRWKAQYQPDRDFVPLGEAEWAELTSASGFFDQLNEVVQGTGRQLVLFALPTNPVLIDTFNRRDDYLKNSKLLTEWASNKGIVFVDAGIQDVANGEVFFSDMRHLSGTGARQYSQKLGQLLASRGVLNARKNESQRHGSGIK